MRKIYILGVIVVLGCSMWVSFNHTLTLYWAGHFRNGLNWGGTIAAETAFLMGVLMIFDSHRKGYKPPWQAKMLFYTGLGVVGWSNASAGLGYEKSGKWTGVVLGVLVLVFIFGAESVLSHSYMRNRAKKENDQSPKENESPKRAEEVAQSPNRPNESPAQVDGIAQSPSQSPNRPDVTAQSPNWATGIAQSPTRTETAQAEPPAQTERAAQAIARPVVAQINKAGETPKGETARKKSPKKEETPKAEPIAQPIAQLGEKKETAQAIAQEETAQKDEIAQKEEVAQPIAQTESPKKEKSPKDEPVAQTDRPGGKVISLKKKKVEDKLKRLKKPDEVMKAIECIWEYEAEHNEFPTKRKLMKLAGCTDHTARKALEIAEEVEEVS